MNLTGYKKAAFVFIAALFLLNGCAAEQVQTKRRYVWPRPPDKPKIEWVKSYYNQHSFPKSGFDETMESLFGQATPIIFEKPIDIKANGKGLVYVTDIVKNSVMVYDLVNYKITVWKKSTDSENSLGITPFYLALDRDDNLYVVGSGDKKVYVLDSTGRVKRKIDFADKIKTVAGLTVDSLKNRLYVVDNGGSKVEVYDLLGKHLFTFGKPGDKEGEFNRPSPITINHKGEIIVGDTMNGRIQIFNADGKFLRKFGQRGDGGAEFQILKGVAVDSEDNIYVTDGKANQIKIFSTNGDFLMSFGAAYSVPKTLKEAPGGFLLPQGIYIDDSDTIYVADQANMRFQVFKYLKDGEPAGSGPAAPAMKK